MIFFLFLCLEIGLQDELFLSAVPRVRGEADWPAVPQALFLVHLKMGAMFAFLHFQIHLPVATIPLE